MKIDCHQHYWKYIPHDYSWISDEMSCLKKDCLPLDIKATLNEFNIDGVIAVQARQTQKENDFLLALSDEYSWIKGVIGWIDLCSPSLNDELDTVAHKKLKGFRHLVQDEPNPSEFLKNKAFNDGVKTVLNKNYLYELLFHEKDIEGATQFCQRHDCAPMIIDHLGKPNICNHSITEWKSKLSRLASLPHVYCKLSGLITEAPSDWVREDISPYIEIAIELFKPERLMFGSDWPVCQLAGTYQNVYELIQTTISSLSKSEQDLILGKVACSLYKINN